MQYVNNTKYWIKSFDVNYEAEILPNEKIRTELIRVDKKFIFFGYLGKQRHFAIDGQLELRFTP